MEPADSTDYICSLYTIFNETYTGSPFREKKYFQENRKNKKLQCIFARFAHKTAQKNRDLHQLWAMV